MATAEEFLRFPKLPTEIRFKIVSQVPRSPQTKTKEKTLAPQADEHDQLLCRRCKPAQATAEKSLALEPKRQWEEAVLEEYRDRIVITRKLQQPFRPVFHANSESRGVANALLPLRLPVHPFTDSMAGVLWCRRQTLPPYGSGSPSPPPPPLQGNPVGQIPVSL